MRSRSKSVERDPKTNESNAAAVVVPPEGTNVLFDVWLVSRATFAVLDAALAPSGLTADEFAIYSVLRSTDAMTPSELARWMAAPLTTVSSYIKRFEGRGHVTRVENPDDGRSYRLQLTAAGRAATARPGSCFNRYSMTSRIPSHLSAPRVRNALQALHRGLSAARLAGRR